MRRTSPLSLFALAFSSFTIILVNIILAASSHQGIFDDISFLAINVTGLSVPPKLASSQFLQDLSNVSGTDFVGQTLTAKSLGLADIYTIGPLGWCGHGPGPVTKCTRSHVDHEFDPRTDLKLNQTSASSHFAPQLPGAVADYVTTAKALGATYVAVLALSALAAVAAAATIWVRVADLVGLAAASLATALLLAVTIVSEAGALKGLSNAINASYNNIGVTSSLGRLSFVSWGATVCTFISSALFFVYWAQTRAATRGQPRGIAVGAAGNPGIWDKVPLSSEHRYVPIDEQLLAVRTGGFQTAGRPMRTDDYAVDGLRQEIPMVNLVKGGTKNLNTAYESYSHQI